jgi:hypothetical protein
MPSRTFYQSETRPEYNPPFGRAFPTRYGTARSRLSTSRFRLPGSPTRLADGHGVLLPDDHRKNKCIRISPDAPEQLNRRFAQELGAESTPQ